MCVQVEGSPRPSAQKSVATDTVVASSQKPAKPDQQAQPATTTRKDDANTSSFAPKLEAKGKKKRGVATSADDSAPKVKPQPEAGDEGNTIMMLIAC